LAEKEKPYSIIQSRATKTWKRGVEEKTYRATFNKDKAGK